MSHNLPHIWSLTVGDWSHDGHGLTEEYTFKSNYQLQDVTDAFSRASAKYNLDLKAECRKYGKPQVTDQFFTRYREVFADNQLALDVFLDEYERDWIATTYASPEDQQELSDIRLDLDAQEEGSLTADGFVDAYLFIAKLDLPDLDYKISRQQIDNENIGGYGLLEY